MNENKILIRQFNDEDFEDLYRLRNDFETQYLLNTHPRPNTRQNFFSWIEKKTCSENGLFFVISNEEEKTIGYIQATNMDFINRFCYAGIAILPEWRMKGVFKIVMNLFETYIIKTYNIKKIIVEIRSDNNVSLNAFKSQGFNIVGEYNSHYYFSGKFYSVTILEKHIIYE